MLETGSMCRLGCKEASLSRSMLEFTGVHKQGIEASLTGSCFSFGAWYDWDPATQKFIFVEGEPVLQKTYREGKL